MKRKLILLVVTIVFLVGFGVILHSPPSMIDAVTGATPKSKKAAQASAQLEESQHCDSDVNDCHLMDKQYTRKCNCCTDRINKYNLQRIPF